MSEWYYNNEVIKDESQFPEGTLGFVYRITRVRDGKMYIGKKLAYFEKVSVKTVTQKNGKKVKKKTRSLVPSDWKTYWSSSVDLCKAVKEEGESAFRREILMFLPNRGSMGYYEARYQMDERVLELGDKTWNGIVSCRVHWKHIKPPLK